MGETYKKQYSGPYQSLEAIWNVLRLCSSEEHPLTVQEIYDHLKKTEDTPPSPQRLKRLLSQETGAIQALCPTLELREGKPPSYSTVDNHLKRILTCESGAAYQLRCVAHRRRWNGEVQSIPYEDIEAYSADEKNNVPRRYYLKGPLPQGAWRFLSDFVRDCPLISCVQAEQLLSALDLLSQPVRPRTALHLSSKPDRSAVLSVTEQIDRAIQMRRKLSVTVGRYELMRRGGRWTPVLRTDRDAVFEPCALVWSGGYYWMVGREQEMTALRLDCLLRAELLEETFLFPEGFDPAACLTAFPPASPGSRAMVRLRCSPELLGDVAALLGREGQYSQPQADGCFEVTAFILPELVKPLALYRPDGVEILDPEDLRQEVLLAFQRGVERYGP